MEGADKRGTRKKAPKTRRRFIGSRKRKFIGPKRQIKVRQDVEEIQQKPSFVWQDSQPVAELAPSEFEPQNGENANDEDDDDEEIDTFPPTFWQKVKSYTKTRVPVICNLYVKHELTLESLISTYLHVGALTAHKALKRYCVRQITALKSDSSPDEELDVVAKESPSQLSRIINWINAKLQKWVSSGDVDPDVEEEPLLGVDEVVEEEPVVDTQPRDLIFYPNKLNLILFPPSLSSVNRVLEGDGGGETDKMSAEQMREELWEQMRKSQGNEIPEIDLMISTVGPPIKNIRKTKRSCFGPNCPEYKLPVPEVATINEKNLKDLNDLAVVISGFDRSPIHYMMGNPDSSDTGEEDKNETKGKDEETVYTDKEIKEEKAPEKTINAFGVPVDFPFPEDDALLNFNPKAQMNKDNDFPLIPDNQEDLKEKLNNEKTKTEENDKISPGKDDKEINFMDVDKSHSPPLPGIGKDDKEINVMDIDKAHSPPLSSIGKDEKELNFKDFENSHIPPVLTHKDETPSGGTFPSTNDQGVLRPEIGRMPPAENSSSDSHPDISINFNSVTHKAVYYVPLLLILLLLIGLCGFLWHRRKEKTKYDMTYSEDDLSKRGRRRYVDVTIEEGSEIDEVSPAEDYFDEEPYYYSKTPSRLQEKGDKKSRRASYQDDYRPIHPKSKKRRRSTPMKNDTELEKVSLHYDFDSPP